MRYWFLLNHLTEVTFSKPFPCEHLIWAKLEYGKYLPFLHSEQEGFISRIYVTCMQPPIFYRISCSVWIFQITFHYLRSSYAQFSSFIWTQDIARFHVYNLQCYQMYQLKKLKKRWKLFKSKRLKERSTDKMSRNYFELGVVYGDSYGSELDVVVRRTMRRRTQFRQTIG